MTDVRYRVSIVAKSPRKSPARSFGQSFMATRFSILNLLLATTIVALSIALIAALTRSKYLEAMNAKMKAESGYFEVEDARLVYARELECNIPNAWRFRIHVPEGEETKLVVGLYMGGPTEIKNFQGLDAQTLLGPGTGVFTIHFSNRNGLVWVARNVFKDGTGGANHGGRIIPYHPIFKQVMKTGVGKKRKSLNESHSPSSISTYPNGALRIFNPQTEQLLPLIFLPFGVEKNSKTQDSPVGVAIWIGEPNIQPKFP